MDFIQKNALAKQNSVRRAIARFCLLNNIPLTDLEFETIVRRTQDTGFQSGVRFLVQYFSDKDNNTIRHFLYKFAIELNLEAHCRMFPKTSGSLERIINNQRTDEDDFYFKTVLYDVVKANAIQKALIIKYTA